MKRYPFPQIIPLPRNIMALLVFLPALLIATLAGTADRDPGFSLASPAGGGDVSLIAMHEDGVHLRCWPESGRTGLLEAELYALQGEALASVSRAHRGDAFEVVLPADLPSTDPADYYLRYRFYPEDDFRQRSLFFLAPILETIVLAQNEYLAGSEPRVRVLVRDKARGVPVTSAALTIALREGESVLWRQECQTDSQGGASLTLELPGREIESAILSVAVKAAGAEDQILERIKITSATRTLLTTDKPMYQPGQTIRMRALSLARPVLAPLREVEAVFEVSDAKGNKVFKKQTRTDAFGVSHADFVLASELNEGVYRINHTVGGIKEEKSVTVERYVLPKFKIALETDRRYYQPGETINGDIQVDYFFGKPVAAGDVLISCAKFDVAYQEFQTIEGKTDAKGHYQFELRLPDHFVGQPVEAGQASVKLDVAVIDGADHREGITRMVSVTTSPILVAAVPEGGQLVPDLHNRIYVVTTYADGSPTPCRVTWTNPPAGPQQTITTDAGGFGELSFTPQNTENVTLALEARDSKGCAATASVELALQFQPGDDRLLLRTDHALCRVGDTLALDITSTRQTGTVYVDLIKDRQTCLTSTLDLRGGQAAGEIRLGPEFAGTVQVSAYLIGGNGVIVRDRRVIVVDPANDLIIEATPDRQSYLPAEQARVRFRVRDRAGEGVAVALGVSVVDEAVFALQEMQPGFEKVYFYLEREIAKPRYEIHGHDLDGIMPARLDEKIPARDPRGRPERGADIPDSGRWDGRHDGRSVDDHQDQHQDRRELAARVLLASASGVPDHTIQVNTFQAQDKIAAFSYKSVRLLADDWERIRNALQTYIKRLDREMVAGSLTLVTLRDLVRSGDLRRNETVDPWGTQFRIKVTAQPRPRNNYHFELQSAGVDGIWYTADDVACLQKDWNLLQWEKKHRVRLIKRDGRDVFIDADGNEVEMFGAFGVEGERFMIGDAGAMAAPRAPGVKFKGLAIDLVEEPLADQAGVLKLNGEFEVLGDRSSEVSLHIVPRVRKYFPETLFFEPALITDGQGRAFLDIPLADSITEWRLSCFASSAAGELGSTSTGLKVFQDFFVDIDFPIALTQNDRVSVPVAIYNYLEQPQRIRVVVEDGDWFDLDGEAEQVVSVDPGEVTVVYFPIVAKGIGIQKFTVFGYGSQMSDAVSRSVEIEPDGKEQLVSYSGRLSGELTHTVTIPEDAIPGASKLLVKIYPGMLSQVLEGLDGMLRMPHGCFEQTSSITYPNVLVLDYLKATEQLTPEVAMQAEGFINNGYQRLLSFEVAGGGFEWFGNDPAHLILTAYGLMEFHDMSRVHSVDPAVISRTQQWLANCQEADGSYRPSAGGIREGAIDKFTDDVLRTTAYLTWALAHSSYQGPEIASGVLYISSRLDEMEDTFTLALAANALVNAAPEAAATERILDRLIAKRTEENDVVFWRCDSETPTHGRGESTTIEVTGLAVQALVTANREPGIVGKAVTFLAGCKDAFGSWYTTQATIQALRGMLAAERAMPSMSVGDVSITLNGEKIETLTVDEDSADLLRLVDLSHATLAGVNQVELDFAGEGALMYQVAGRYYVPQAGQLPITQEEPLAIDLEYDRTQLATDDILNVKATVSWHALGRAKMIIVDLGLPPGFVLLTESLDALVSEGKIQKYDTTGRQIIVYLEELSRGAPVTISYELLAKYPLQAKTARSSVYEYYNPQSRAEADPVEINVTEG